MVRSAVHVQQVSVVEIMHLAAKDILVKTGLSVVVGISKIAKNSSIDRPSTCWTLAYCFLFVPSV